MHRTHDALLFDPPLREARPRVVARVLDREELAVGLDDEHVERWIMNPDKAACLDLVDLHTPDELHAFNLPRLNR